MEERLLLARWQNISVTNAYSDFTRYAGAIGERKYSSYSFLTLTLHGLNGQRHAPAARDPRLPLHVVQVCT
jgi:hypothetical protein